MVEGGVGQADRVGGADRVGVASSSPGFNATSSYICAMAGLPSLSDPLALGP